MPKGPEIFHVPEPPYEKVEIINTDEIDQDPTMLTILLHEEDHTIGNALKHIICQMPGVEFCGYNVPHPLEDKILIRIQTEKGVSAREVLHQGLNDLIAIFDVIRKKFEKAHSDFTTGEQKGKNQTTNPKETEEI